MERTLAKLEIMEPEQVNHPEKLAEKTAPDTTNAEPDHQSDAAVELAAIEVKVATTPEHDTPVLQVESVTPASENHQIAENILPSQNDTATLPESSLEPPPPVLAAPGEKIIFGEPDINTTGLIEESQDVEILDSPEYILPTPLETFIHAATGTNESLVNLQGDIEEIIAKLDIEISVEEVSEVVETFVTTVADIKETIEAADEVTTEQVEAVVTATEELLKALMIEPNPAQIKQIVFLTLGEDFSIMYEDLINDSLVDELGTHEHKIWAVKSTMFNDEMNDHPSLLGKIALQLGLSMQPS